MLLNTLSRNVEIVNEIFSQYVFIMGSTMETLKRITKVKLTLSNGMNMDECEDFFRGH